MKINKMKQEITFCTTFAETKDVGEGEEENA